MVLIGFIDKIIEADAVPGGARGGFYLAAPGTQRLTFNPRRGDIWSNADSDLTGYGVAAVIPFSRNVVFRPLFYYFDVDIGVPPVLIVTGDLPAGVGQSAESHGYIFIFNPALGIKAGIFTFDIEYRLRHMSLTKAGFQSNQWHDWSASQHILWAEVGVHPGPFSFTLAGLWLQGSGREAQWHDDGRGWWNTKSLQRTGMDFQPQLLLFSEDIGLLWDTWGVPNGTWGMSGYRYVYGTASYKINDTMKLMASYGAIWADKMVRGASLRATGAARRARWFDRDQTPDTFIGAELDFGFEWQFMDNLKYVGEVGMLWPGGYWDSISQFNGAHTVFGMRHMLVINW
jgi:hypothetical protein